MARTINAKQAFEKTFKTFEFEGLWKEALGTPETTGAWIVYGDEKNGKTWFSLMLAQYLSSFERTMYVSAEEGLSYFFVDAMKRAKIDPKNKSLQFSNYLSLDELSIKIAKQKAAKIIVIDNLLMYDEVRSKKLKDFIMKHQNKLLIFMSHEERKQPAGANGKMVKKLSNVIVRVVGLKCFVSGRVPGGTFSIDKNSSELYHGTDLKK